ncbi:MAG: hypothetical protein KAS75_01350 [Planctomycetes bacterium]|nr:hypothetical protein [Planctomycetota bacterium]
MDESQASPNSLVDTTDCLEAIGVFRVWKNSLFLVIVLTLFLLQASFWFVNSGYLEVDGCTKADAPVVVAEDIEKTTEVAEKPVDEIKAKKAETQPVAEPNQPAEVAAQKKQILPLKVKKTYLAIPIRLLNSILIITAILHCLTMLFSLKVSLLGRLGGINHIARAFFLSLIFLVFLLPWQLIFAPILTGAMFTTEELLARLAEVKADDVSSVVFFYWRFTGYSIFVLLLLIFSQIRSARWTKATLRRLEVI